ncbi:hypothetical protein MPSEU_001052300 [Mayamaea pseudoterrestris]|nr:hypothetical protein MPSEU_001052300 [Mayamaea pseudoterrestris]
MDHSRPFLDDDAAANQHEQQLQMQEFNNVVENILMNCEELRRSLNDSPLTEDVMQWRDGLEHLMSLVDPLDRWTRDAVNSQLEADLFRHCHDKIRHVASQAMQAAVKLKESDPEDPYLAAPIHVIRTDGQTAIARITELNIVLQSSQHTSPGRSNNNTENNVQESQHETLSCYVAYQRQVLRQRAKPAIARLVQARRDGIFQKHDNPQTHESGGNIDEDEHEDDDEGCKRARQQYHAPVIADILGQAAALIHPFILWLAHLPPIDAERNQVQHLVAKLWTDSIQTVNAQAQELVQTIANWFWEDCPMDDWMAAQTTNDAALSQSQLSLLDGLVEEMAFACQVQARYKAMFVANGSLPFTLEVTTVQDELLPEFTWKYASLERYLALQQWQSAVALAVPVPIVMGTNIHVPSVVEDAQYLSTRALERAALTESTQAIGTVAHAISHDVWSTDDDGGVLAALREERGCWMEVNSAVADHASPQQGDGVASPPQSGFESGFVSALMDALDEDEPALPQQNNTTRATSSGAAPSSGNFLLSFVGSSEQTQQSQMDADFCVLNGFHAACGACRALVNFLDTLLASVHDGSATANDADGKTMAMIRLAREELFQYEASYQNILDERVRASLVHWCGTFDDQGANWDGKLLPRLRVFFEVEDYVLNEDSFEQAEKDERLNTDLLAILEESKYLHQLSDKCDAEILILLSKSAVTAFVELILDVLWKNEKHFTDLGALLFSKEVRMIQTFCSKVMTPSSSDAMAPNLLAHWERLFQVTCILQLERPADWLSYTSTLTPDEVDATLRLRKDFSQDAVQAVVAQLRKTSTNTIAPVPKSPDTQCL